MNKIRLLINKENILYILPLLPILFFIIIIPMLIGYREIEVIGPASKYWIDGDMNYSFYSYIKSITIPICAGTALIFLAIQILQKKIQLKMTIPISLALLYGILIIISSLTSRYAYLPIFGAPDRYEGMIVLLSYIIMFIYTLLVVDKFEKAKVIIYTFIGSICFLAFIGSLEFFGFHLVELEFFRKLFNYSQYSADFLGALKVTALSFYSINYVGQYLSLVIPLILFSFYYVKKKIYVLFFVLVAYFAMMCVFGSYSFAAFIAIIVSIIVFITLFRKQIFTQWIKSIILVVILITLYFITNWLTAGLVGERALILSPTYEGNSREFKTSDIYLSDIIITDIQAFIDTDVIDIIVSYENNIFIIKDSNNNPVSLVINDNGLMIVANNPSFEDFSFDINNEEGLIRVLFSGNNFYMKEYEGKLKIIGYSFRLLDIREIKKSSLQFPETLFSGRGIIYNGLLPSVKDHLLFGNGPDTTILSYPQDDILGKINTFHSPIILVSKPHSLYLQILHDLGLFAFLIFVGLISYYAITSVKLYIKLINNQKNMMGGAIAISIMSYLIASICYDSTVHISPIFWILLALGIIINKLNQKPT